MTLSSVNLCKVEFLKEEEHSVQFGQQIAAKPLSQNQAISIFRWCSANSIILNLIDKQKICLTFTLLKDGFQIKQMESFLLCLFEDIAISRPIEPLIRMIVVLKGTGETSRT